MDAGNDGSAGGGYDHRQLCPLAVTMLVIGVVAGLSAVAFVAAGTHDEYMQSVIVLCGTFVFGVIFGCTFISMRVQDAGDRLVVSYGPMRLVVKEVLYKTVDGVGTATIDALRTWQVVDGRPARVCGARRGPGVRVDLRRSPGVRLRRAVLIGTDDVEGLTAFLESRMTGDDTP